MIEDNIKSLVDKLSLQNVTIKGNELSCLCPFHPDKTVGSFSINLQNGLMNCFSCHASGNLITLAKIKGVDYEEYLILMSKIKEENKIIEALIIYEPVPDWLITYYRVLGYSDVSLNRMCFDVNILEKYNVYCDEEDNTVYFINSIKNIPVSVLVKYNKADIPIYNGEWRTQGYFFGMGTPATNDLIITEGIWDAMYVNKILNIQTWALIGTSLSNNQIKYLSKSNRKIYWMLDGDKAGKDARTRIHGLVSKTNSCFCGGYNGKDPDMLSEKELWDILQKAKSWEEYHYYQKSIS